MRVNNPGSSGVTSVTGTAPVTSSGGATPAIGLNAITYWTVPVGAATLVILGFVANQTPVVSVLIQYPVSAGHININVVTLDNSANKYDFGLYNAAGTLVANTGGASYATTGEKSVALAQGTVVFQPGLYWLAWTGNAAVLQVTGVNNNGTQIQFGSSANAGASVGGVLPATITPPTIGQTLGGQYNWCSLSP